MRALVTDADIPTAVAAIRGLGRGGVETVAYGPQRSAAGRRSRYATVALRGPQADEDPAAAAGALADAATEHGPLVAYPATEEAIDAMLAAERWPGTMPYPGADPLNAVRDKPGLADLAGAAGLAVPETLAAAPAAELRSHTFGGRCVVKPLHKGGALAVARRLDGDELASLLRALPGTEQVLVQRETPGSLGAISLVIDREGAVAGRVQQRTLTTWPAEAGPSRRAVTIEPDEPLIAGAARLLADAGYWGLAQLQFMGIDSGDPRLIDINPRYYGSLSLALAAGVNLPALWHRVVTGEPTPPAAGYRPGVTYRWVEADIFAALHGDAAALVRRAERPRTGPMWASDDPRPSVVMAGQGLAAWLRRRLPGGRDGS
ncbi:MAG: ATP-grasp domain-containing protein [Solirubrobacterales bacterium]